MAVTKALDQQKLIYDAKLQQLETANHALFQRLEALERVLHNNNRAALAPALDTLPGTVPKRARKAASKSIQLIQNYSERAARASKASTLRNFIPSDNEVSMPNFPRLFSLHDFPCSDDAYEDTNHTTTDNR